MRNIYNTKQKELIVSIIKKQSTTFTIKDIYNALDNKVGLTTIYRLIDKLVKDGIVIKNVNNDSNINYRYLEKCSNENHFYLKCDNCGTMIHVDCECIGNLSNHILKKHSFQTSCDHVIITGLCDKCNMK